MIKSHQVLPPHTANHLLIFVKNPVAGKVKTRLANSIGDKQALEVYQKLLAYTHKTCLTVNCSRSVWYSEKIDKNDIWEKELFQKHVQQGLSLGEKMQHAFSESFILKANKVLIIGSDCPELTPQIIEEGFEALKEHDVVLGPAQDGGYYLLGMKKMYPDFFVNKKWSSETVFEDTINDISRLNLTSKTLKTLSDIDFLQDLKTHKHLFSELDLNI